MTAQSNGVGMASKPVVDPQVKDIKQDIETLLIRIDEEIAGRDKAEGELSIVYRENVALRQLLATRWSSLGHSLGVPGGVVAFIILDVDGNRMEVGI